MVRTKGPNPNEYGSDRQRQLLLEINRAALNMSARFTQASPVGVAGLLRNSWKVDTASKTSPTATVSNSRNYFLPVELGRRPGKGISEQGQEAVALWGRRKLGLSSSEATSFAYLLSQKYKREGRPAQGFIGLAQPGSIPTRSSLSANQVLPQSATIDPVSGSLLDTLFTELGERLKRI